MKKILSHMRKAVQDFNLIEQNDKIGIGLSGGKDSMVLMYALKLYQRFCPVKYELEAFTIDLGFDDFDVQTIENFCKKINVPFNLKKTHIKNIVFDIRKEKNPCSLCAKMRRGAIHNSLKEKGFNKLAFAHHADDAIETLFLSMFYEGRISTFSPKTYLSRKQIHVIRPFIYLSEYDIKGAINKYKIPIVKNPCYVDRKTKREYVHNLLKQIYKEIPQSRTRLLTCIKNKEQLKLWF